MDLVLAIAGPETVKAKLFYDDDGEEIWLPLSQIEWSLVEGHPQHAEVQMPEWLAIEKGLL